MEWKFKLALNGYTQVPQNFTKVHYLSECNYFPPCWEPGISVLADPSQSSQRVSRVFRTHPQRNLNA